MGRREVVHSILSLVPVNCKNTYNLLNSCTLKEKDIVINWTLAEEMENVTWALLLQRKQTKERKLLWNCLVFGSCTSLPSSEIPHQSKDDTHADNQIYICLLFGFYSLILRVGVLPYYLFNYIPRIFISNDKLKKRINVIIIYVV